MKFHPDTPHSQSITAYGAGWIEVNRVRHTTSLLISAKGERLAWDCHQFENLAPLHFEQIVELNPELVLFGSGDKLRFPKPHLLESLFSRRIGVETMDTQAACRTYNFLAAEGRMVVAALLL